jgi:predicted negative regulator of RcsB-dependent stress response
MALLTTTNLAVLASLVVAALTGTMAYLGWRSFQKTRNTQLVFVAVAFLTFLLKSLFVAYNVHSHAVPHDAIELVSAVFDLLIATLLFLPFFVDLEG